MYDKEIVLNLLENMIEATQKILHRNKNIKYINTIAKTITQYHHES